MPLDLSITLPLLILSACAILLVLRVEPKARWVAWVFVAGPGLLLVAGWAMLFNRWLEAAAGVGGAALVVGLWWLLSGRKLPPTTSDSIKVWGQDAAPKPKAADLVAMQEEIMRLQDEKAQMEEDTTMS